MNLLAANLRARGYDKNLINKAIDKRKSDASLGGGRDLYQAGMKSLLHIDLCSVRFLRSCSG